MSRTPAPTHKPNAWLCAERCRVSRRLTVRLSHFFIDHPRFAAVINIFIVIFGLAAVFFLPTAQYPNIVPPTVTVQANFPGASAETVARTVATPLE